MFYLRFFVECAATDLSNFSYSNAGFIFVNAQANVVAIDETNFEVVAASCYERPLPFQICDWRLTKNRE